MTEPLWSKGPWGTLGEPPSSLAWPQTASPPRVAQADSTWNVEADVAGTSSLSRSPWGTAVTALDGRSGFRGQGPSPSTRFAAGGGHCFTVEDERAKVNEIHRELHTSTPAVDIHWKPGKEPAIDIQHCRDGPRHRGDPAVDIRWKAGKEPAGTQHARQRHHSEAGRQLLGIAFGLELKLGPAPEGTSRKEAREDALYGRLEDLELPYEIQGEQVLGPRLPQDDSSPHLGQRDVRVLMVGLDAAGKTTIIQKLKFGQLSGSGIPTIGYNEETIEYKDLRFAIWDVGGQDRLRPLWPNFFKGTEAVIFVADSADRENVQQSHYELHLRLLSAHELLLAPLLVFANKQDLPCAMSLQEIAERLGLHAGMERKWFIQPTCALSGDGLYEGLEWLRTALNEGLDDSPQSDCN